MGFSNVCRFKVSPQVCSSSPGTSIKSLLSPSLPSPGPAEQWEQVMPAQDRRRRRGSGHASVHGRAGRWHRPGCVPKSGCPSSPGCSSLAPTSAPGELAAGMGCCTVFSCKRGVPALGTVGTGVSARCGLRDGAVVPQDSGSFLEGARVEGGVQHGPRAWGYSSPWSQELGLTLEHPTQQEGALSAQAGPAAEPICSQAFLFPPPKHL